MTRQLVETEASKNDVIEIASYIATNSSLAISNKVIDSIQKTFGIVAEFPGIGVQKQSRNAEIIRLKYIPVSGYPTYLIFYEVSEQSVIIRRVLHGSRNIDAILQMESQTP